MKFERDYKCTAIRIDCALEKTRKRFFFPSICQYACKLRFKTILKFSFFFFFKYDFIKIENTLFIFTILRYIKKVHDKFAIFICTIYFSLFSHNPLSFLNRKSSHNARLIIMNIYLLNLRKKRMIITLNKIFQKQKKKRFIKFLKYQIN